jgi:hypothetical protein
MPGLLANSKENTMKNWLVGTALRLLWLAAGRLGRDISKLIEEAEARGLGGRSAFDYVWRQAKGRYSDVGDWLLNLLIEALLGQHAAGLGELAGKLRWPRLG